jgi:osmotically inducible protein OsmC
MPTRRAEATWKGAFKGGQGWFKTETGVAEGTVTAGSRFESEKGSNPEELLGAAHASCFSMAFALELGSKGHPPKAIDTSAEVTIEKQGDGYAITGITLHTKADVPGVDDQTFQSARLLMASLTLNAERRLRFRLQPTFVDGATASDAGTVHSLFYSSKCRTYTNKALFVMKHKRASRVGVGSHLRFLVRLRPVSGCVGNILTVLFTEV